MHTTDDESKPPLNSAQTVASARRRAPTASDHRARNCSSYWCLSLKRTVPGFSVQNLCRASEPAVENDRHVAGGTAAIPSYGVISPDSRKATNPATNFSSSASARPDRIAISPRQEDHKTAPP